MENTRVSYFNKTFLTEDGYNKQRSMVSADYSYIDLEDILEDDDEGLGDQLGEGPGKLSICIYYCVSLTLQTKLFYFLYNVD